MKEEIAKLTQDMAHWLIDEGCAILPLQYKSKIPHQTLLPTLNGRKSWSPFIDNHPSHEDVDTWFREVKKLNIGLICGQTSGIVAVDVDGSEGLKYYTEVIASVARPSLYQTTSQQDKLHAIYRLPANCQISPNVKKLHNEIDIRGEHSYIVIAPSIHPNGTQYRLYKIKPFDHLSEIELFPVFDTQQSLKAPQAILTADILEGERDDRLMRLCAGMFARGMTASQVLWQAKAINFAYCKPPLDQTQVEKIVRSMVKMHGNNHTYAINAGGVERWISDQGDKVFSVDDIFRQLNVSQAQDKEIVIGVLKRLVNEGIIERHTDRSNIYRKVAGAEVIDITKNNIIPEIPFYFMFGLDRYIKFQPRNIIIVAGESNSGKTAFLFSLVYMNSKINKFRYITSEMTQEEIVSRISKFGITPQDFQSFCTFISCARDYDKMIDPDGINIIDFLEIYDNFSKIGEAIKLIFDSLHTGMAIIAIQKKKGSDFGRGGEFTLEKARLAVSLYTHGRLPGGIIGSMKIIKCKNFREGKNPEGQEYYYQLDNGSLYNNCPVGEWWRRYWTEKQRKAMLEQIEEHCESIQSEHVLEVDPYGEQIQ